MKDSRKHIVIDARIRQSSTGRYVDRLLEHLQTIKSLNTYTVLLAEKDNWKPKNENFKSVKCKYRQFSFSPLEQFGYAKQLYSLKPDLVHFTMTQQPLLYFGKNVTTTHDLTMLRYAEAGKLPELVHQTRMLGYRFLLWQSHRKAKQVLVPTKYVKKDLVSHHPFIKNKVLVTYESSEPPNKGQSMPISKIKAPFIFHIGAPFPHKNIDNLVKAFDELKKTNPDLKLVLAGKVKGHFKEKLFKWVKNCKSKNCIITTGYVHDRELKWLYENAEAYVLPSLSEGFGLPGLEAMAHGCPLVSSDATCLPEIYGDAAEYFDPNNVEDMARAIEKVIKSKKVQKDLVSKGKQQLEKYSWNKMAKQTLAAYEKAMS